MVINSCERCGKTFPTNATFKQHMNRKTPCNPPDLTNTLKFQCTRCTKRFINNRLLSRHLSRQKPCELITPPPNEIDMQALFEKLKQEQELVVSQFQTEIKQLKTEVNDLKTQNQTLITTNNNNCNNTTNNNITINKYGQEDISHITDAMYKRCFKKVKNSVVVFLEMKYFSSKMPSNHNFYISNMRNNQMVIYKAERWDNVNKAKALENIYYAAKDNLSNVFDKMREEGRLSLAELLCEWYMDGDYTDKMDDEETIQKNTSKEFATIAYNHRKIPMEMKNIMEKHGK